MVHTVRWTRSFLVRQGQKVSLGLMQQGRIYLATWPRCLHPAFREFKQRFMNFCAHFGSTRPHPFPTDGEAVGDPPPPRPKWQGRRSLPPPPPAKLYPGLLRQSPHHATRWVLFWMVMMPPALMHHHLMH